MSILEHPRAQALLQDAELTSQAVVGCRERLADYLQRYLPSFYRHEQRRAARVILEGKFSNLQRKTAEPIARQAKCKRKAVQHFLGGGKWADDKVMQQFKAWCSRRLNEATVNPPEKWWAIHGSTKWINQPQYLEEAIQYVMEGQ